MTYTKKQFLEDVRAEATAIKEHATPEEISNLDFDLLDPQDETMCVYGSMTGDCKNHRACLLITRCCVRYVDMPTDEFSLPVQSFPTLKPYVNGRIVEGVETASDFQKTRQGAIRHFSALEVYIMMPNAKNANLIAFLKGERKDLVL